MKVAVILFGNYDRDGRVQRISNAIAEDNEVKVFALTEETERQYKHNEVTINLLKLESKKLPKTSFFQIFKYMEYVLKTLKRVRSFNPDIVHCNDIHTIIFAWFFKRKNRKLVYDSHELWKDTQNKYAYNANLFRLLNWFELRTSKLFDAVITVNESISDILSLDYKIKKPIIIRNIPNFVESPRLRLIHGKLQLNENSWITLYLGGFSPGRGLENLIRSFKYVADNGVLVFLGYGVLINRLTDLVDRLELNEKVYFLDPVDHKDVHYYIASADIGVIPYQKTCLNHYYALPNKLFQFPSFKVPIVSSDFPELKKHIDAYRLGYTFDPENPEDIAKSINRIIEEKFVISDSNYKSFIKQNSWNLEKKKMIKIYNDWRIL